MKLYTRLCQHLFGQTISVWAAENNPPIRRVINFIMRDPAHCEKELQCKERQGDTK